MKLFKMTLASLILASNANAAIPVFERVRANIYIYKMTIERVGDDFKWNEESICRKTVDMDVLDVRGGTQHRYPIQMVSCDTTFEGFAITLNLHTNSTVGHMKLNGRPGLIEAKTFYTAMSAMSNSASDPAQRFPELPGPAVMSTKDLKLKSLIHELRPNQGILCVEQLGPVETTPMPPEHQTPGLHSDNNTPTLPGADNCSPFNPVAFGAVVEYETL